MRPFKLHFDTTDYVATHGKNPKGLGGWAFSTKPHGNGETYHAPYSTYREAKEWASVCFPFESTFYVCG